MKFPIFISIFFLVCQISYSQWEWQNPYPQGNHLNDLFFIDENIGWAAGEFGIIMKTYDGGNTWELIPPPIDWHFYSIYFTDSLTGYICTFRQVMKSVDGGYTWFTSCLSGSSSFTDVYFQSPDSGWALSSDRLVIRTTDAGNSWETCLQVTGTQLRDIFFVDSQKGWLTCGTTDHGESLNGRIYLTYDGGNTWHLVYSNDSVAVLSVSFPDPSHGWAACYSDQFFGNDWGVLLRTTDGGLNWTEIYHSEHFHHFSDTWFCDANTGWLTGYDEGFIARTDNSGYAWTFQADNLPGRVSTVFGCNEDLLYSIGSGGRIYKTENGGTDWNDITSGYRNEISEIIMLDEENGWAVGYGGLILKTENGGEEWLDRSMADDINLEAGFFTDTITGFITGEDMIFKTIDGGNHWELVMISEGEKFKSIFFSDPSTGWCVGEHGYIMYSDDGGESWVTKNTMATENLEDIFFSDQNNGWIVGWDGLVMRTTDGGDSWLSQELTYVSLHSVYFIDELEGWIAGWYDYIYHTTDGGINWELQNAFTGESNLYTFGLMDIYFTDPENGWTVGYGAGGGISGHLKYTFNGGENWEDAIVIAGNKLNSIVFSDPQHGWMAGGGGTILHTNTGIPVWESEHKINRQEDRIAVFPNPFHKHITIQFESVKEQQVQIFIYDHLGNIVGSLQKKFSSGNDQMNWSPAGLATGIYYCVIRIHNEQFVKKIIKL